MWGTGIERRTERRESMAKCRQYGRKTGPDEQRKGWQKEGREQFLSSTGKIESYKDKQKAQPEEQQNP